jgi:succinate dehydrogenase / fumarate reductase membrane anchor subunit
MSLRTPLSEAKGLGSAKEGVAHWWLQRLTAIALIPLAIWLAFAVSMLGDASYETIRALLETPYVAVLLILLVAATFYHTQLGLQVIVEDYVHGWLKVVTLIVINFLCIALAVIGILALLKIFL